MTDRMSVDEYRHLEATGEWPDRLRGEDASKEAYLAEEEERSTAAGVFHQSELNRLQYPQRTAGQAPKVTPDLYQGDRILRVSFPLKYVPSNNMYRDAIVVGGVLPPGTKGLCIVGKDGRLHRAFTKRVKSKKAKALQKGIRLRLLAAGIHAGSAPAPNTRLMARLWIHGNWSTKAGDIRIADVCGAEKLILDTVGDYLGLQRPLRKKGGDEAFFRVDMIKVEDKADGFTLEICQLHPIGSGSEVD